MDSLVKESNGDVLDINSLPDEVILKIFDYLKQNQLGQIARVCRRWDVLTRSPVLWKKVNVQIFPSQRSLTAVTESFINGLPFCVTSIRFDFNHYHSNETLDFVKFCVRLQEKCPHLEVLILANSELSCSFSSVIDLCFKFLQDAKKLVFRFCEFSDGRLTGEWDGISKLEILNVVFGEYETVFREPLDKPPFSRMPYLKELHVCGTPIGDSWFEDDTSFLNQLHVLYLGCTDVSSRTLSAIKNHGRNLKMLCLNWINGLEDDGISKLEILNVVFGEYETVFREPLDKPPFSRMPYLKELHVCGTPIGDSWFEDDTSFLNQLHVLYLGCTDVSSRTLSAIKNHGRNLKMLCLNWINGLEDDGISKLEILNVVFGEYETVFREPLDKPPFSRMPYLKELHVCGTPIGDSWFEDDTSFLNQLHVLYLGCTDVSSRTLSAIKNHGRNLKMLCLNWINGLEDDGISKLEILNVVFGEYETVFREPLDKPPFSRMPYLKELHVCGTPIGDSWFEDDTSFLNQLHVLYLGCTDVSSRTLSAIKNHGRNLKMLCLNWINGLEDDGISKLEILNVVFGEYETVFREPLDKPPFSRMPYLKELHVCGTPIGDSWFEDDTSFLNQLHVLYLGCTDVSSRTLSAIKNHGRNLKMLCLNWINGLEDDGISKLEILNVVFGEYETVFREPLDKPPFSRMPYLKELHVCGTPIGDSWFEDDTSFLNQLHVLYLGCTDVSSRTLSAIKNHGRNLKMLCLNWINGLEDDGISKLEILNVVFGEYETVFREPLDKPPFSRMPYLKELHVCGTPIGDSWFEDDTSFLNQLHVLYLGCTDVSSRTLSAIKNHGRNLKMLCLNWINGLEDDDLNFNHSVLSKLETICLRDCGEVTCEIVVSLIQSCQSLQNVYVDKNVAESFVEHPFVVANRCKSSIVKVIDCNHDEVLY